MSADDYPLGTIKVSTTGAVYIVALYVPTNRAEWLTSDLVNRIEPERAETDTWLTINPPSAGLPTLELAPRSWLGGQSQQNSYIGGTP